MNEIRTIKAIAKIQIEDLERELNNLQLNKFNSETVGKEKEIELRIITIKEQIKVHKGYQRLINELESE